MADPILTLGELEPERPTVRIFRTEPANRWEAWKERHLPGWALRLVPVVYERRAALFPMRHPTEFSLEDVARIQAAQREIGELQGHDDDPASVDRTDTLLRELSGRILDAPREVLDELSGAQHIQILLTFPAAVVGMQPAQTITARRPTSGSSYRGSAPSTARTTG